MLQNQAEQLKQVRQLKLVSDIEGITLLALLGIAVPLKHVSGWALGVQVMGPVHGLAFLTYLWLLVQTAAAAEWPRATLVRLIVVAAIPFGGFINARQMAREAARLQQGGAQ